LLSSTHDNGDDCKSNEEKHGSLSEQKKFRVTRKPECSFVVKMMLLGCKCRQSAAICRKQNAARRTQQLLLKRQ